MTIRFMDIVSSRGGSWILYVHDHDVLDVNIVSPAAGPFKKRFEETMWDMLLTSSSKKEADIRALMKLGVPLCGIGDVIEAYSGVSIPLDIIASVFMKNEADLNDLYKARCC